MYFTQAELSKAKELRQQIHSNPELKYEEIQTAQLVAKELENLGYEVQTGVAKTGVVALLKGKNPQAKVIAFRADMDALPIVEQNKFAYASKNAGKMHACGHDGHTATLLLAAMYFARNKEKFQGSIKLIFQPAEEGGGGANAMCKAGVLQNPKVDLIFGYHNRPFYEENYVFVKSGSAMGGNDAYELLIEGASGHSAMPNKAVDSIYIAGLIITGLQGVVGRLKSPLQAGAISVTTIQAGSASNVIASRAKLTINIRSDSPECKQALFSGMQNYIKSTCEGFGASYELKHIHHTPALVNDPKCANELFEVAKAALPQHRVEKIDFLPTMGAEDFAYYLLETQGCFFFVGNGKGAYLHTDEYDFNDAILPTAASVFVALAHYYLEEQ